MNVLRDLGIKPGDRVATFAWNHRRHLELYFAVPCLGAVLHTVNLRLHREQLRYIFNHAQDCVIFADRSLAGLLAGLAPELPTVKRYVLMDGARAGAGGLAHALGGLRATDGGRQRPRRVPCLRRTHGRRPLLHVGDHGRTQRGPLQPPFHLPARDERVHGRYVGRQRTRNGAPSRPDVPRQRLGPPYSSSLAGAKLVFPGPLVLDRPLAELLESGAA